MRFSKKDRAWSRAEDVSPAREDAMRTAVAVDGSGRVHVSYYSSALKYATCAASCTTAASWQTVAVDPSGYVGRYSSLAVDGSGRVHVSYNDLTNHALGYATCAANCTTATSWQTALADQGGGSVGYYTSVGYHTSVAVDGSDRVHVSYWDLTNAVLKYATCAANCTTAANWQTVVVDQTGPFYNSGTSLAVDGSGRVLVSYRDDTYGGLKYATCAASCTTATSWQTAVVDQSGDVGWQPSLAVDRNGAVHVSYWDRTNGDLKYIR